MQESPAKTSFNWYLGQRAVDRTQKLEHLFEVAHGPVPQYLMTTEAVSHAQTGRRMEIQYFTSKEVAENPRRRLESRCIIMDLESELIDLRTLRYEAIGTKTSWSWHYLMRFY
jgi:hypothetical protein